MKSIIIIFLLILSIGATDHQFLTQIGQNSQISNETLKDLQTYSQNINIDQNKLTLFQQQGRFINSLLSIIKKSGNFQNINLIGTVQNKTEELELEIRQLIKSNQDNLESIRLIEQKFDEVNKAHQSMQQKMDQFINKSSQQFIGLKKLIEIQKEEIKQIEQNASAINLTENIKNKLPSITFAQKFMQKNLLSEKGKASSLNQNRTSNKTANSTNKANLSSSNNSVSNLTQKKLLLGSSNASVSNNSQHKQAKMDLDSREYLQSLNYQSTEIKNLEQNIQQAKGENDKKLKAITKEKDQDKQESIKKQDKIQSPAMTQEAHQSAPQSTTKNDKNNNNNNKNVQEATVVTPQQAKSQIYQFEYRIPITQFTSETSQIVKGSIGPKIQKQQQYTLSPHIQQSVGAKDTPDQQYQFQQIVQQNPESLAVQQQTSDFIPQQMMAQNQVQQNDYLDQNTFQQQQFPQNAFLNEYDPNQALEKGIQNQATQYYQQFQNGFLGF